MPQCLGRRSNPNFVYFPNTNHRIYPEIRCQKETTNELCPICSGRTDTLKPRLQSQPAYPHGIIGHPIPSWSHIYGGPWYQTMRKICGDPVPGDLKKLEEAKEMATKGIQTTQPQTLQNTQKTDAGKKAPKKKSNSRNPSNLSSKKKPVSPTQTLALPSVVMSVPLPPPDFFESTDESIPVECISSVQLEKVIIENVPYWKSEVGEYFVYEQGGVGSCVQFD